MFTDFRVIAEIIARSHLTPHLIREQVLWLIAQLHSGLKLLKKLTLKTWFFQTQTWLCDLEVMLLKLFV
ncbi:hypothetical protein [Nostoc sp. ChiVER01]|uniref:hypothetical protein n=1 Tax=Nostoc sp. ChiVER01 TaxID=3075382 RepID=UPI002AD2D808|nr:hypothetical protein [Nostoc sp. ChiVER01]MDZ8227113.1 hypothetical protein [Nostoc sp. ChiVER01]